MTTDPQSDPRGRATRALPDELAVAIPHLRLVLDALGGYAEAPGPGDRHDALGLARVRLRDTAGAAALFAPVLAGDPQWRGRLGDTPDLELVVSGLRRHFSMRWGGWSPTFGKNRELVGGEGTPAVKYSAEGLPPSPAERPDGPYTGERAGDVGLGGRGLAVGLLDTPLAAGLDLGAGGDPSTTLPGDGAARSFRSGHGTFLAGLLRAYAPEAAVVARPVLDRDTATTTSWDLAVALVDLAKSTDRPVDVVLLALGCFTRDNQAPLVLKAAVDMVRDDVVIVAAGGNYGDMTMDDVRATEVTHRTPMWPAALDGVVAVGSHSPDGTPSGFSPQVPWVDVTSCGEDVVSTFLTGPVVLPGETAGSTVTQDFRGHARWAGSSMAAAVAAGRLASLRKEGESVKEARDRLLRDGDDPYVRLVP